jgi:hypothetical protein
MNITTTSSLREVAFVVCTSLDRSGTIAVLTGGSAATVYAPAAHQSRDLDFVLTFRGDGAADVIASLGYTSSSGTYSHPENPLTLEFVDGPLQVGRDVISEYDTLRESEHLLNIISPTDSCRDRLAGFMFWNDRASLTQAAAVAREQTVDMKAIAKWCRREEHPASYDDLARMVHS